jgi:hypothetical protein
MHMFFIFACGSVHRRLISFNNAGATLYNKLPRIVYPDTL